MSCAARRDHNVHVLPRHPPPGRPPRVARLGRDRAPLPRLRHGPHGAQPRRAGAERRAASEQHAALVDRRHLRLPRRRPADHDGHARRPHRPPAAAVDRRRRLRRGFGARCPLDDTRAADRRAGAARDRRCDARAVHARADPQHVRGPGAADLRGRRVDHELLGRRGDRPARRRRAARALLVGLRVPAGRPGDGVAAARRAGAAAGVPRSRRRDGWTSSAPRSR